jgi:hypothetical protein
VSDFILSPPLLSSFLFLLSLFIHLCSLLVFSPDIASILPAALSANPLSELAHFPHSSSLSRCRM